MEILILVGGLVVGGVLGWLLCAFRSSGRQGLSQEQAGALTSEAENLRLEKGRQEERNSLLEKEVGRLSAALDTERLAVLDLTSKVSKAQTEWENAEERFRTQKAELESLQARFTEEFENIAQRILLDNSQKLQQQHKEKLDDLLSPLKEKIDRFERKVDDTHREAIRENQSLKEQIAALQKLNVTIGEEAKNLTTALKGQAKAQGNWGEIILERLLELSGLVRGREYSVQASVATEDGRRLQPDVVVHLPENKNVVVDSKVSLVAYERFCNASDQEDRAAHLRDHCGSIRRHIKELGAKNYQAAYGLESLDFVLMFIPVEPAYMEATAADAELFREALEKNILLVSTSSLLAALRLIANVWRMENQNRNAMEIARQGGELYDKFVGFAEDFQDVGNRLRLTQKAYDDALGKLAAGRGNLVSRAQELKKLGARTAKSLPPPLLDKANGGDLQALLEDRAEP